MIVVEVGIRATHEPLTQPKSLTRNSTMVSIIAFSISIPGISPYASLFGFLVGLPTLVGTYYQTWKTRQESRQAREGLVYSENCLEFVLDDGTTINLVPLETLHTLPKPGDVVLLPGTLDIDIHQPQHAAYRVNRIEFIYSRVENRHAQAGQARLAKAVAHLDGLTAGALSASIAHSRE